MAKFLQKETIETYRTNTPEQYLWVSVLSKAAHDAIYTSDWLEARKAIAWFKSNNRDFREVCVFAGVNPDYVSWKMMKPINHRENHMEYVRTGNRLYVKDNTYKPKGGKFYHAHYRLGKKRGKYKKKKKHLSGNSYYAAKRKKDPYYVRMGKLGGRPRIYNNV